MAVLTVSNISKSFGENIILDNVSFTVNKGNKVAIIGDNGEGKTTLLKIIIKEMEPDSGSVHMENINKYGYLSQTIIENLDNSLLDEMKSAFSNLLDIEKEMEDLTIKMQDDNDYSLVEKYAELNDKYSINGGYDYIFKIKQMLNKFGFDESYYDRKLKTFSGGEKSRAAFAKLLLETPALLLLDEPTNHLDLIMIEWLENYLKNYPGTVIIVSHDQTFIDNFADKIIEIEDHKATMYSGNYTYYLNEKQLRYEQLLKQYENQEKLVKRYEFLINKFRYKRSKAAFANALETKLEKMDRIEKPKNNKKTVKAHIDSNLEHRVKMHVCEHLLYGYDNVPLTNEFNLTIYNQDKICIMGQNGCGKTTLLNCLMTNAHFISGYNRDTREGLKYFYFDQTQDILDKNKNVFDTIRDDYPLLDNETIRNLLGRFLFTEDDIYKEVSILSGGEKIRLIFAILSLRKYDILYLDEPTNHLDFSTKKVMAEMLDDYNGTIIMVSHDRYFVNYVANKIVYIQNKEFIIEEGNYQNFISLHKLENNTFMSYSKKTNEKAKEEKIEAPKKKSNKVLEKQLDTLMEQLEALNAKMNDENAAYNWLEYKEMEDNIKKLEEEIETILLQLE